MQEACQKIDNMRNVLFTNILINSVVIGAPVSGFSI